MKRLFRSALVIGRRDFTATVLSRTFIFFLLGPLFPLMFGAVFGSIGARVAQRSQPPLVMVAASTHDFAGLSSARDRLQQALGGHDLIRLTRIDPDKAAQQQPPSADEPSATLTGLPDHPRLAGAFEPDSSEAAQVRLIVQAARGQTPVDVVKTEAAPVSKTNARTLTGQAAQWLVFFLTLLLAGMTLSQLIEEKSNKVIEILAAAVPIEAVFLGKLFAMLAASLVGIAVWASAGVAAVEMLAPGGLTAMPPPAVGWPAFVILTVVYFAMNYLLLGSVFLSIGAQASTVREVQTLSMPVTMVQLLIFGFAALAVGAPNSPAAIGGAIFPLSSGLVMVARAAELPQLWPHLIAVIWELLWVGLIIRIAAGLFRKTVLKSGPARRGFWRIKAA